MSASQLWALLVGANLSDPLLHLSHSGETSLSLPTPSTPPEKAATGVSRPKATLFGRRRRGRQTLRRLGQIGSAFSRESLSFADLHIAKLGAASDSARRVSSSSGCQRSSSGHQLPSVVIRESEVTNHCSAPHCSFGSCHIAVLVRRIPISRWSVSMTSKSSASGVNTAGKRRRVYARALNLTTEWRLLWEQWSQRGFAADDRHLVLAPWFLAR